MPPALPRQHAARSLLESPPPRQPLARRRTTRGAAARLAGALGCRVWSLRGWCALALGRGSSRPASRGGGLHARVPCAGRLAGPLRGRWAGSGRRRARSRRTGLLQRLRELTGRHRCLQPLCRRSLGSTHAAIGGGGAGRRRRADGDSGSGQSSVKGDRARSLTPSPAATHRERDQHDGDQRTQPMSRTHSSSFLSRPVTPERLARGADLVLQCPRKPSRIRFRSHHCCRQRRH